MRKSTYSNRLESVLKSLTYREREIIKLRHGIDDGVVYTLREVGRIFKLSHPRILQIETEAIRKLQHPMRARKLREAGLFAKYAQITMPGQMLSLITKIHRA